MSTAPTPTTGPYPGAPARTGRGRARAGRFGHVIGALVNLALLYVVNVWPGWDALPFLTAETTLVLGLVNASLWVSVAAEITYVAVTAPWWRALGEAVTTMVGLAAVVRIWEVFPFDVSSGWELAVRLFLGIAAVGSIIGIVAALWRFITALTRTPAR